MLRGEIMNVRIIAKKKKDKWEGAEILETKFTGAFVTDSLWTHIQDGDLPRMILDNYPEGTLFELVIDIATPKTNDSQ